MLAGPDALVVLYVPGKRTQDESLHNLAQHRGQADRPLVPSSLLPATKSCLCSCRICTVTSLHELTRENLRFSYPLNLSSG